MSFAQGRALNERQVSRAEAANELANFTAAVHGMSSGLWRCMAFDECANCCARMNVVCLGFRHPVVV